MITCCMSGAQRGQKGSEAPWEAPLVHCMRHMQAALSHLVHVVLAGQNVTSENTASNLSMIVGQGCSTPLRDTCTVRTMCIRQDISKRVVMVCYRQKQLASPMACPDESPGLCQEATNPSSYAREASTDLNEWGTGLCIFSGRGLTLLSTRVWCD